MQIRNLFLFGLTLLLLVGCGDGRQYAPLKGQISFKGKPLDNGIILLQPVAEAGAPMGRGEIQPDGSFEIHTDEIGPGGGVGEKRIRVWGVPREQTDASLGETTTGRSLLPERYNNHASSGLKVEVQAENNPPLVLDLVD
jgi:hypothetical protein